MVKQIPKQASRNVIEKVENGGSRSVPDDRAQPRPAFRVVAVPRESP